MISSFDVISLQKGSHTARENRRNGGRKAVMIYGGLRPQTSARDCSSLSLNVLLVLLGVSFIFLLSSVSLSLSLFSGAISGRFAIRYTVALHDIPRPPETTQSRRISEGCAADQDGPLDETLFPS